MSDTIYNRTTERGKQMGMTTEDFESVRKPLEQASLLGPFKGKKVKIREEIGTVFWHGKNRYRDPLRYSGGQFSDYFRLAAGRYGYRIGVDIDGTKRFFDAEEAIVCVESVEPEQAAA